MKSIFLLGVLFTLPAGGALAQSPESGVPAVASPSSPGEPAPGEDGLREAIAVSPALSVVPAADKTSDPPPALIAPELAGQTVREIRFRGNTQIDAETLRGLMETRAGQPIDLAQLERDLSALEAAYHRQGYTLMRALSPDPLSPDGILTIPVQEGVVESIQVVGNRKTKRWVILRQMETRPGMVYNEKVVRDDRERLKNLGIFNDVQVGSAAGTELGQAVVSVKVVEARTGEIFTTLGYSNKTGLIGYFYGQEENLAGTARQLNARWERYATHHGSAFQASFFTPWTPLSRTSFRITGYRTSPYRFVYSTGDIDDENIRSYEVRSGGAVQLARELTVRNQLLLGFRNDSVDYEDLPIDVRIPSGYSLDVGTIRVFSIGLANDTRDLRFNPRRGGVQSTLVEFGQVEEGGGDFVRLTANLRRYQPVGKDRVLAYRLILGTASGDVPLPELFWLGGPDTLRGYYRDSFHGKSMAALNTELRIPVGSGLQAVGFVDAGQASDSGGLKASIGAGLRVITPIGPLRIDFALGSDGVRSHFTAGYVAF